MADAEKSKKKEKKSKKEGKEKKEKKSKKSKEKEVEETEPTDEVEQPRTPHTPTGEGSHEPHLDKKPLKGILKKEGEENVDRKGLSVAGLESVPEPTADDSVKTKVIEGKKGIVRKGTSGEALKKPKGSDSTSQKKDEKSNKITKKPSGGDNTKNMIVKKK